MIITLLKSHWIQPSTVALLIEETTYQTDSRQIESNVGFWLERITGVSGRKPLRTDQQTQATAGQEIEFDQHRWEASARHHCDNPALLSSKTKASRGPTGFSDPKVRL